MALVLTGGPGARGFGWHGLSPWIPKQDRTSTANVLLPFMCERRVLLVWLVHASRHRERDLDYLQESAYRETRCQPHKPSGLPSLGCFSGAWRKAFKWLKLRASPSVSYVIQVEGASNLGYLVQPTWSSRRTQKKGFVPDSRFCPMFLFLSVSVIFWVTFILAPWNPKTLK